MIGCVRLLPFYTAHLLQFNTETEATTCVVPLSHLAEYRRWKQSTKPYGKTVVSRIDFQRDSERDTASYQGLRAFLYTNPPHPTEKYYTYDKFLVKFLLWISYLSITYCSSPPIVNEKSPSKIGDFSGLPYWTSPEP